MKILKTFVREFSGDTETPITLFYKYVGNEKGFLLESRGEGKTNYSFMGKHPMAILSGNDKLTIDEKGKKTVVEGKLLDSVRDYMKGFKIETDLDLCYTGGAVGGVVCWCVCVCVCVWGGWGCCSSWGVCCVGL